jgi:hypothetical protein
MITKQYKYYSTIKLNYFKEVKKGCLYTFVESMCLNCKVLLTTNKK